MRHPIRRGFFKPLLAAFGATEARSYVDVTPQSVEIVFGLSRHVIPRSDIVAAKRFGWPAYGGIGWRIDPDTLGLIGSLDGVVLLQLAGKHVHHVLLAPLTFRRLCVSMEDPDALIRDLGVAETA